MGFFKDAFKSYDKCKTTEKLDYNRLYEIVKELSFPCGKPELSGNGIMRAIRFPAVDKYQIMLSISGKSIQAAKSYSGVGGIGKEMLGDALTGGAYTVANKENLDLNAMTRTIIEIISKALKEQNLLAE